MVTATSFELKGNTPSMDIKMICPFCDRKSHLTVSGKKRVTAVMDYISGNTIYMQNLPLPVPEREFLAKGTCRECLDLYFGVTSKNIRYVKTKKERSNIA